MGLEVGALLTDACQCALVTLPDVGDGGLGALLALAGRCQLIALLGDLCDHLLHASLDLGHAGLLLLDLALEVGHPADDVLVLVGDPLHERGPLEEVVEPFGFEHDGDDVGRVLLVALHQPLGQRLAPGLQLLLELLEVALEALELIAELVQLLRADIEPALDRGLLLLQPVDLVLEAGDSVTQIGDLSAEVALLRTVLGELCLRLADAAGKVARTQT